MKADLLNECNPPVIRNATFIAYIFAGASSVTSPPEGLCGEGRRMRAEDAAPSIAFQSPCAQREGALARDALEIS
ncbi:hypothetical protein CEXT_663991 [Caerostris extrusa]|uniref:Uncharacterized protein n=1 Tax=Caerostris extrusa TaxID=172846 RepID=A0AAV4M7E0_CAEEX|nr:hypothetical protein CEXT_663991 [Caerostris extrusa]